MTTNKEPDQRVFDGNMLFMSGQRRLRLVELSREGTNMIVGLGSALKGLEDVAGVLRSPPARPEKKFGNKIYHAWALADTKLAATTIAKRVRNLGYLARVGKHDVTIRHYTVWVSE